MLQIIIVPIIFILVLAGMLTALHFSKYKQHGCGTCGGEKCDDHDSKHNQQNNHGCYSSKVDYLEKVSKITG